MSYKSKYQNYESTKDILYYLFDDSNLFRILHDYLIIFICIRFPIHKYNKLKNKVLINDYYYYKIRLTSYNIYKKRIEYTNKMFNYLLNL